MADRNAIHDLLARYAAGNDKRDLEIIKSTLSEDVTMTIAITGGDSYGPFEGRDAVLEFMGAAFASQSDLRRHVITNITVIEDGDTEQRVNSYLTLIVTDNGQTEIKSAGIYESRVVNGKLSEMVLTLDNGF